MIVLIFDLKVNSKLKVKMWMGGSEKPVFLLHYFRMHKALLVMNMINVRFTTVVGHTYHYTSSTVSAFGAEIKLEDESYK